MRNRLHFFLLLHIIAFVFSFAIDIRIKRFELLSSQEPYNKITYEIVGDDAAPTYFEVEPTRGEIKVKRDIKTDTETSYQVNAIGFYHLVIFGSIRQVSFQV